MDDTLRWIELPHGRVGIDERSGALAAVQLQEPDVSFIDQRAAGGGGAGLLRLGLPLPHYAAHYAETGVHGSPDIESVDGGLRLRYAGLTTREGPVAVTAEIDLIPSDDGLRLRARVHNGGAESIPLVVFPQLMGLEAVDGVDGTRLQLARRTMLPLRQISMRPDDAFYLDRSLQEYLPYSMSSGHTMKWLDYGSARCGLTLYARDTHYRSQGLLVERPDRAANRINVRWAHYPFIAPGETWDSDEFVLFPHAGDWYAGARAYQRFAAEAYPSHAPRRVQEALGVRSMWAAVRNNPPTFPLAAIADYAAEIADPELGLAELIIWHWWLKNGYPIFLDPRLGSEAQFKGALDRCRALGVPVSLFVSHHLVRDTDETDPSWEYQNAAHQRVVANYTYGPGFLPLFGAYYSGTHSMVRGTARSPGWRATGLQQYRSIQEKYGPVSICFDQFGGSQAPDYNPAGDGRPDSEGEWMLEFGRQARALIHEALPDGTFSGEGSMDVKVPVLDYSWEWKNGFDIAAAAPFRYVFPQYRLNANVNEHPRGALLAFMEGALLNVMPGNMHSFRLRDCPDLVAMLRKLAALRRQYLRYFTEGQYRYMEGLTISGGSARVYTHGEDVLVIAINPTDAPAGVTLRVDPSVWSGSSAPFEESFELAPEDLRIVERTRS